MATKTFADALETRSNNFDFLRCLLAVTVMYSHAYGLLDQTAFDPLLRYTHRVTLGAIAVNGFFAISGFLVTHSWLQSRNTVVYFSKRILRIYPGFIMAAVITALVVAPLASPSVGPYVREFQPGRFVALTALLRAYPYDNVFQGNPLRDVMNSSLWTIPVEFGCYILMAGLGLAGMFRRRIYVLGAFLLALGTYAALETTRAKLHPPVVGFYFADLESWPRLTAYYLGGAAFYCYRDRIPCSKLIFLGALAVLAASVAIDKGLHLAFLLFGTYALFFTAFATSLKLQNFGRWGDFSYGIYLYAFPVQQLTVQCIGGHGGIAAHMAVALVVTTALAAASWYLVERPCLRLKGLLPRRGSSRRTAGEPREMVAKAIVAIGGDHGPRPS